MFPSFELLGWYAVGGHGEELQHMKIHQQFMEFNESPLFLLVNPDGKTDEKTLPITVFDSEVVMINDTPTRNFVPTSFKVKTAPAERIAVDHVANIAPTADGGSACKLV